MTYTTRRNKSQIALTREELLWSNSDFRIGRVSFFGHSRDLSHEQYTRGITHNFVPAPRFLDENGSFHTEGLGPWVMCRALSQAPSADPYVPAKEMRHLQKTKWGPSN